MKFMVFDTETTGLPKNYKAPVTDVANWPRIIQLAWIIYDDSKNELKVRADLVKPDGWVVPKEKFWIENNLTQERCETDGVPIELLLNEIIEDMVGVDILVSHNMSFDSKILGAEMVRKGMDTGKKITKLCTKVSSTNYCKIPHKNGNGYKWPTLDELHRKLFNEGFDGAHDALVDVRACGRCLFELMDRGVIKLG